MESVDHLRGYYFIGARTTDILEDDTFGLAINFDKKYKTHFECTQPVLNDRTIKLSREDDEHSARNYFYCHIISDDTMECDVEEIYVDSLGNLPPISH